MVNKFQIRFNLQQLSRMDKGVMQKEVSDVQRQGNLQKQSRFFKSWRMRWVVLTNNFIYTFKDRRVYDSPTEAIHLKEVVSIKSCEEDLGQKNTFKIDTNETTFFFASDSPLDKEGWIGAIGKAMVRTNNMHIDD